MADRYIYDQNGNLIGSASSLSPVGKAVRGLCVAGAILFGLYVLFGSGDSSGGRRGGEDLPRPSDEGFVSWVRGKNVFEDGKVLWRIDPGEVSDLRVLDVERDPLLGGYAARVAFRVYDTVKRNGGNVEASVRYKTSADKPGMLDFVSFTATSFEKTGRW